MSTRKTHTFTSTFTAFTAPARLRTRVSFYSGLSIYLEKRPKARINFRGKVEGGGRKIRVFKTFRSLVNFYRLLGPRCVLLSRENAWKERNETVCVRVCVLLRSSILLVDSIEKIKKGNCFLFLVNNVDTFIDRGKMFNSLIYYHNFSRIYEKLISLVFSFFNY